MDLEYQDSLCGVEINVRMDWKEAVEICLKLYLRIIPRA
jgi:hypothetical protein